MCVCVCACECLCVCVFVSVSVCVFHQHLEPVGMDAMTNEGMPSRNISGNEFLQATGAVPS